jgi:hypothetical protein
MKREAARGYASRPEEELIRQFAFTPISSVHLQLGRHEMRPRVLNQRSSFASRTASDSSSPRAAGSRNDSAAFASAVTSGAIAVGSAVADASASFATGVRTGAGMAMVPSHPFAPAHRAARDGSSSSSVGSQQSETRRAATKQASATSRAPPIGARPASAARCRNRKTGAASAYGGSVTGTRRICACRLRLARRSTPAACPIASRSALLAP